MGTPKFAVPSLQTLLANGCSVVAVVTAPDKPRGRGRKVSPTPIKQIAFAAGIPILQPESLKQSSFLGQLTALAPDIIVVVAFRILPREVFSIPRLDSFNLHASLLPMYRGAAPINWAIINGETTTGVTTFLLQEKVDTGGILLQESIPIEDEDNAGTLHDKLALLGASAVLKTVRLLESREAVPMPQDESKATPAPKISREDCRIDWRLTSLTIHNWVRGLSPYPAATTTHNGKTLKLYKTEIINDERRGIPGQVEAEDGRLRVATGDGMISVAELQVEGKDRMQAPEFLRGYRIVTGDCLV